MKIIKNILFINLLCTILFFTNTNNSWSATFYKCRNALGELTFSDTPCRKTDETLQEKNVNRNKISTIGTNKEFVENSDESESNENYDKVKQIGANNNYVLKSKIANILSSFSDLKITMREYYSKEGKWPENFSDIGLSESEMKSKYISRLKLKKNGKLVAYLNKNFGKNKILMLEPKNVISMGKDALEWVCFTNFPKEVLSNAGDSLCQSRKIYY